ncbi:hypothetical protein GB937_001346 [Aspergillus fischeri]|nr:hypothetical protein GB937_001346 [Aspergillus fischeri]
MVESPPAEVLAQFIALDTIASELIRQNDPGGGAHEREETVNKHQLAAEVILLVREDFGRPPHDLGT